MTITTDNMITAAVSFIASGMIGWAVAGWMRYCREIDERDVVIQNSEPPRLSPPPPPLPPTRFTTHTTVEWIDGAYQVVETKVYPIEGK